MAYQSGYSQDEYYEEGMDNQYGQNEYASHDLQGYSVDQGFYDNQGYGHNQGEDYDGAVYQQEHYSDPGYSQQYANNSPAAFYDPHEVVAYDSEGVKFSNKKLLDETIEPKARRYPIYLDQEGNQVQYDDDGNVFYVDSDIQASEENGLFVTPEEQEENLGATQALSTVDEEGNLPTSSPVNKTTTDQPRAAFDIAATKHMAKTLRVIDNQDHMLHLAAERGDVKSIPQLVTKYDAGQKDPEGRIPLMCAVMAGSLDGTKEMLKLKDRFDAGSTDNQELNCCHWAMILDRPEILRILIAENIPWTARDEQGRTVLHWSVASDTTSSLEVLLEVIEAKKPQSLTALNAGDKEGMTALHWCTHHEKPDHVALLLKAGAHYEVRDIDDKLPIHWAAANSGVGCLQHLVEKNKNMINMLDSHQRTALHMAVAKGNKNIVSYILSIEGCDVNPIDATRRAPLHWAAASGHTEIVASLIANKAIVDKKDVNGAIPLHYAAQHNHADTVIALCKDAAVFDVLDKDGRSPVVWAVVGNAPDACETLVKIGCDVNIVDKDGRTPLHAAANAEVPQCMAVLLEGGANVDAKDNSSQTPIFSCCDLGNDDCTKLLLKAGAATDVTDEEGKTPLHWAAVSGRSYIVIQLVDHGCNINAADARGQTALMYACYSGHIDVAKHLMQKKALTDHQDLEGVTALHWAALQGHSAICKLLLEYGAKPNLMEFTGSKSTPFDYAAVNNHEDVLNIIVHAGGVSVVNLRDMAAISLQSCYRGYKDRKKMKTTHPDFMEKMKQKYVNEAVITVQKTFKRFKAQKLFKERIAHNKAAIKIQAAFKGNRQRRFSAVAGVSPHLVKKEKRDKEIIARGSGMAAEERASNLRRIQKEKKDKYKKNKKKFRKGKKKLEKQISTNSGEANIPNHSKDVDEEIDTAKEQREIVKQVMTDFSERQKKVKMERLRVKLHKEQMEAASRIQAMYRGFGTRRDEGLIKTDYRQMGIDMARERKRRERGGSRGGKKNRSEIYERLAKSNSPTRNRTISEGGADRRYQVALLPKLPQSIQDRANKLRRFHTSEGHGDPNCTTGSWSGIGSGAINFSKDELIAIRKAFEGMSLKTSPRRKLLPKLQQQRMVSKGKNPTTITKYLQSPDNQRAQRGIKAKAKATLKKIKRPEWDSSISQSAEFGHTPFSRSRPNSLLSTL
eukprot:UC4_evm2s499